MMPYSLGNSVIIYRHVKAGFLIRKLHQIMGASIIIRRSFLYRKLHTKELDVRLPRNVAARDVKAAYPLTKSAIYGIGVSFRNIGPSVVNFESFIRLFKRKSVQ